MADEPTITQTEAFTAALAKLNAERQKELDARKKLAQSAKLEYERLQQEINLLEEQRKASQNMVISLNEIQQTAGESREAAMEAINAQVKALGNLTDASKEQKETLKGLKELQEKGTDSIHENIEALKNQNQQVLASTKNLEELKKRSKAVGDTISTTSGAVMGLTGELGSKGLGGALGMGITQGVGFKDTLSAMATSAAKLFNPMNLVGNVIANTVNRTMEFGKMQADLRQLTASGDEMNKMFLKSFEATRGLGVATEELAGYWRTLETSFEGFNRLTQTQQVELTNLTATMERYDVAVQDTVDAQEFMQQALQMSSTQAAETQADMVALGKAIGRPTQIIMRDFKSAQNVIAQFGKTGFDVFKKLSAQAEATGMEMNSLLGIAEGFDTFDSAADKVGSLNALMGGAYFDTMTMVAATEAERIELMREGIAASGKSWEAMGRFERKSIMAAAGISDMTEANKLFGNSLEVYYEQEKAAAIASGSLSSLSAEAKKNLTPQEKLAAITNQMTMALQPLIDGLSIFLDVFIKLTSILTSTFGQIAMGIAVLVKFRGGIGIAAKGVSLLKENLGSVKNTAAGFFKTLTSNEGGLKKATQGLFKMKDVTKDLAVAGKGTEKVGKSFAQVIKAVGSAAQKSKEGILALGGAILMIGGGIAIAALGMAELVRSFQELTGEQIGGALAAMVIVMGGFVALMYAMVPAIAALGAAGTAGSVGLLALGAAFLAVGAGVKWAASGLADIAQAFASVVTNIDKLGPEGATYIKDLSSEIDDFMQKIDDMDLGKLKEFYATVAAGRVTSEVTTGAAGGGVGHSRFEAIAAQQTSTAQGIAGGVAAATAASPQAPSVGGTPTTAAPKQEVILEVDGKRLGRVVYDSFLKSKLQPVLETV
jgi:hypothetical protein